MGWFSSLMGIFRKRKPARNQLERTRLVLSEREKTLAQQSNDLNARLEVSRAQYMSRRHELDQVSDDGVRDQLRRGLAELGREFQRLQKPAAAASKRVEIIRDVMSLIADVLLHASDAQLEVEREQLPDPGVLSTADPLTPAYLESLRLLSESLDRIYNELSAAVEGIRKRQRVAVEQVRMEEERVMADVDAELGVGSAPPLDLADLDRALGYAPVDEEEEVTTGRTK